MRKLLKGTGYTLLILFVLFNTMTAFNAYKLTHFYNRNEIDSTPHAGGLHTAGVIFFGQKSYKSLLKDVPATPYDTFTVITPDHVSLAGWHIRPDTVINGTVLLFHGHAGCRSDVVKEADAFHRMGYDVYLVDFRAHGVSEGNVCTVGYDESKDVKALYDYALAKGADKKRMVLWGISMGAATVMKAVSDFDLKPGKLILEMPFGSLLDAVKGRLHIMQLPPEPLSTFLTFWGGTEQGFWAFGHKPWEYARKINCPVLLQWGIHDPRVTEAETHHIFQNIDTPHKTLIKYANSGHESLYKKEPGKWQTVVGEFLQQQ
ncbi:alpha/beta hydrolase [Deminuibacter soli]|uniref:Alpha/beta fold hydrolase n=1 Tax=Deminuibacter soli TaxID=2291815 RepID=A0A3E1NPQ2_9BACT|nr:alpha/beta fold hydrolase [Deminuibacter soli]RFM29877.1 alpha/beta fold hydrolase [Deminuibacter soli]